MNIKSLLRKIADKYPILVGIGTYIPGLFNFLSRGTGGTINARYCYSVWLRHLVIAHENGLLTDLKVIAELGPGDSLGVGLAAMISGADKYYALDVVRYANNNRNIKIFNELVKLFNDREKIPNELEFPKIQLKPKSYEFPGHILTSERLKKSLDQERIKAIKEALLNLENNKNNTIQISYSNPWDSSTTIKKESVDMVFSQAVMEHVDNVKKTYEFLYDILKKKGFVSQEIDFKSHKTAKEWNGHWQYSDFMWKLLKGKRVYLINRHPFSKHINFLQEAGFGILHVRKYKKESEIKRKNLASRFKNISDEDLITSEAFIQAVKS